ncbi:hypothetical protein RclHR1_01590002 [Rhizophagus clarus]|uniref:Protein kinase domain-containing protein n=1 Tax=Rhizophagus clarus TaxID=94130 RepID=A0A2Z6QGC8_9GLOM|nr:hypothetical protein RclHR1_01590002 [Rhizophagus clarus]
MRNIKAQFDAMLKADALMDWDTYNDSTKRYEFRKQRILNDESLTEENKTIVMKIFNILYDHDKILHNKGIKRSCENCQENCLATYYCEHCMRNYLKANLSNWTSGNDEIDNLIQKYQMESLAPNRIVEWISYDNLQNISYLTEGKCYSASWVNGFYNEWDAEKKQLVRSGTCPVILKKLDNIENINGNWSEEILTHLNLSNKCMEITRCYGLTRDQVNRNIFLVISKMDEDLRKYLSKNHNTLTWNKKISIMCDIVISISRIHSANIVHRNLNSRNILLSSSDQWYISGFEFSGPVNKTLKKVYGNLPYVAPEIITGKEFTFASDIYSIGVLMWEISFAQSPFNDYEHDYDLAIKIVNGMRPKITPGIPLEYSKLIKQCWDADPLKRPSINTLGKELMRIRRSYYQDVLNQLDNDFINSNNLNSKNHYTSTSKLYRFEGMPEPKNVTEEEQEAFHSKLYNFSIPDNNDNKIGSNSNNNQEINTIQQHIKKIHIVLDDEEKFNNANLHSEEQDQLEIPDGN